MTKSYAQQPSLRQTANFSTIGFITTLAVLLGRGRIPSIDAAAAIPDAVVGLLFVVAFAATSSKARSIVTWQRSTIAWSARERARGYGPIKPSVNSCGS